MGTRSWTLIGAPAYGTWCPHLQVGEELAAQHRLKQQVQEAVVLEAGHQGHHEGTRTLRHHRFLPDHVLLHSHSARRISGSGPFGVWVAGPILGRVLVSSLHNHRLTLIVGSGGEPSGGSSARGATKVTEIASQVKAHAQTVGISFRARLQFYY